MSYNKPRNGKTIKEVRSEKDKELKQLLNYLNSKWQHANSTAYSKVFRLYKLIEMSNEITYYLLDEYGVVTLDERYMLLSMIRYINRFIDLKDASNKAALEDHLERLEGLKSISA